MLSFSFFLPSPHWGRPSQIFDLRFLRFWPLQIFDEIFVNTVDNKQQDPSMDALKVNIDAEQNTTFVFNSGDGIPVEIPELICDHLLTNSNYDVKITGGRNDDGAKLTNIFSTESKSPTKSARSSISSSLLHATTSFHLRAFSTPTTDKPFVFTADELYYFSLSNFDWKLALEHYNLSVLVTCCYNPDSASPTLVQRAEDARLACRGRSSSAEKSTLVQCEDARPEQAEDARPE
ncbi:hypothetical protein LR48_Vigan468s000200 [Vigna angularis]|uniref:DNA topoisomerase (ATP-hydrolyzing) n=1 Tax=Phaseolus angularis TaxID=3914 RepID=A0A0L9TB53_PHAAN|nr:hypothetical protein LR48_Vigan468s000200 [Vigna angularis]